MTTGSTSEEGVRVKILFNIPVTALTLQLEQNLTNDRENLKKYSKKRHCLFRGTKIGLIFVILKKLCKIKNGGKTLLRVEGDE